MAKKYHSPKVPIPYHNAKKNQFGYERYTQDSEEHLKGYMVALNNRFPNLVGFGILQYLKQLMAMDPRAKIHWCDPVKKSLCSQMNVQRKVFDEVLDYCINTLEIFRITRTWRDLYQSEEFYLIYPDFMEELLTLEVKKIREEADTAVNKFVSEKRAKEPGGETSSEERKRMINEMKEFLILTPEITKQVQSYFSLQGEPDALWDNFRADVWRYYKKWHAILNPENYASNFYVWLNRQPFTEKEKADTLQNIGLTDLRKNQNPPA